jgi:hypothetical protein
MWRVNPNDATSILYDDMNILGLDVMTNQLVLKDALTIYAVVNYGKNILEVFLLRTRHSRWLF